MTLISLALVAAIAQLPPAEQVNPFEGVPIRQDILLNRDGSEPRLMIRQPQGPLPKAKIGPRKIGDIQPEFDWITWGFAKNPNKDEHNLRFRVYAQERDEQDDTALKVTRTLLRLLDINREKMRVDHPQQFYFQLVNVYLCYGGKAGGEQFSSADIEGGRKVATNNIYIYQIESFLNSIEMLREVSHEYGHAVLPAVGPYRAPENWASGYLGEKIYMSWIADILEKEELVQDDFMGATAEQVRGWVRMNVDPLMKAAATTKPSMGLMADKSAKGMDAYLGLAVYMSKILPGPLFARTLKLTGSQDARDYPNGILLAVEEPVELEFKIPESLRGQAVWLPISKGRITGGKVLKQEDGWALVQPGPGKVVLKDARAGG